MFDVGFTELLLIGVVALVVIGPERLPAVARTVGQYVGKLQRFVTGVKRDIRNELESGELKQLLGDQKNQIDELRKMVNTTRRDLESGTREVMADAKRKFADVETSAKGAGPAPKPPAATAASPLSIAKESPAAPSDGPPGDPPVPAAAPVPAVSPDVPPVPAPAGPPVAAPLAPAIASTSDRVPGTPVAPARDAVPVDTTNAPDARVGNG